MADNNDNINEVSIFPFPSLVAKATFSRSSFTRYSSPFEITFTVGDPMEPAPASSVLLRHQFSQQNSSSMVLELFRNGRMVTFCDNFDNEEQGNKDGSHADSNRTLSTREAVVAAEATAAEEVVGEGAEDEAAQPVMMSLIDLLEEID
ncbi:uncharacterized protein LOC130979467 [Arachis stenosperma]|uniref:uncharacterized protein LOC130979467 n=1 Tax=Arachis stenosperma TaxID=217475 RepID=UPI0025AD1A2D|nr:uncharacterized protein LOC130979467 [Arachis stenosperma]